MIANQYLTTDGVPQPGSIIRSLITYNRGSLWDLLPAPKFDSNGQATQCLVPDGCSLHLHVYDTEDNYDDYLYAVPNAVGTIIGSGNIGRGLEEREDLVGLYFSRDGGVRWSEVRKGRWIYEVGDHGSIIVALHLGNITNSLIYSNDEGVSWKTVWLQVDPFLPVNIVTSGWSSTLFIIYGSRINNKPQEASHTQVLVYVDFFQTYIGPCLEGDFEDWSPTDVHGNCFMGHRITYRRRKVGKACYLGEGHVSSQVFKNCPCTVEDYECDYCFDRTEASHLCTWHCGLAIPSVPPGFCDNSTKDHPLSFQLQPGIGYKKIATDSCTEDASTVKPVAVVFCDVVEESQPWWKNFMEINVVLPALLVVGLVAILFTGVIWYCYKYNQDFKDTCCSPKPEIVAFQLKVHPEGYGKGTSLLSEDSDLDLDEKDLFLEV
eukprot:TRINITY_DN3842_c0_g2_i1.p1 TRINITY_DN3842_c0_g2~~TRINITY_DN3842_c0_g2_i1.p1  ORF type:complete len:433 (+),score=94.80 TRINITY_DN3842_c0_g2_i1:1162-2460(+)